MPTLPKSVTRRDFINGVSVSVVAGATVGLSGCGRNEPGSANSLAESATPLPDGPYPPSLTGLRGSHEGSFEVAHDLAWSGKEWPAPAEQTDTDYDLIVVGAGISGLAAAYFYRQRTKPDARILILDNHDDFGGHAKRNEFDVDGKKLIAYGGSQSIDTPSAYSDVAKQLFSELALDTDRFYKYFDRKFFKKNGLSRGIFYDAKTYGVDKLAPNPLTLWDDASEAQVRKAIDAIPLPDADKKAAAKLFLGTEDYLPDLSADEKVGYLAKISYIEFLTKHAGAPATVTSLLRRSILGLWGVEWDTLSALEGVRYGMPAAWSLGIYDKVAEEEREEPYIFHFPDGNASVARLLVRALIPEAIAGDTMEDIVKTRANYGVLDREDAPIRLRLESTAISIRNADDASHADVVYVNDGAAHRVRARHVVMAGYMHMAPHICPEMGEPQKEAIRYPVKTPLVYINVALRNWRPMKTAGYSHLHAPNAFCHSTSLDFPVSMGGYSYPQSPDAPMILTMQHFPVASGTGLSMREQYRAGQHRLYQMSFDDFEREIAAQLSGMFSAYGFDAARDIAGITVNRWPHGYAYEYHELFDPADWNYKNGPHIAGRAAIGRISFANSDTEAKAYVNGAIDAAHRAVSEQLAV